MGVEEFLGLLHLRGGVTGVPKLLGRLLGVRLRRSRAHSKHALDFFVLGGELVRFA